MELGQSIRACVPLADVSKSLCMCVIDACTRDNAGLKTAQQELQAAQAAAQNVDSMLVRHLCRNPSAVFFRRHMCLADAARPAGCPAGAEGSSGCCSRQDC